MPFLERYMKQRYSPATIYEELKSQAPAWLEQLPDLPNKLIYQINQADKAPETPASEPKRSSEKLAWFSLVALVATVLHKPDWLTTLDMSQWAPLGYIGLGAALVMLLKSK
jgi:ubiquinone biosynthesis protein